jgi:hypothetical protein
MVSQGLIMPFNLAMTLLTNGGWYQEEKKQISRKAIIEITLLS